MDVVRNVPQPEPSKADQPLPNSEVEEFFLNMKGELRRPRPNEEAIAEASKALQRLTEAIDDESAESSVSAPHASAAANELKKECPQCGGANSDENRFCAFCGISLVRPVERVAKFAPSSAPVSEIGVSERHVHHHHYHHHYFPGNAVPQPEAAQAAAEAVAGALLTRVPETSDAETALRKLVQSWVLACNAKHFDALASLYLPHALLLRSNRETIRGRAAIRRFIEALVKSGLGDVQLECIEVSLLGEVAFMTGRNRMLMPIATGSRQDRAGKFFWLLHQDGGEWKILADIWCLDAAAPAVNKPRLVEPAR